MDQQLFLDEIEITGTRRSKQKQVELESPRVLRPKAPIRYVEDEDEEDWQPSTTRKRPSDTPRQSPANKKALRNDDGSGARVRDIPRDKKGRFLSREQRALLQSLSDPNPSHTEEAQQAGSRVNEEHRRSEKDEDEEEESILGHETSSQDYYQEQENLSEEQVSEEDIAYEEQAREEWNMPTPNNSSALSVYSINEREAELASEFFANRRKVQQKMAALGGKAKKLMEHRLSGVKVAERKLSLGGELRVRREDYSLRDIVYKYLAGGLILDPEYQRHTFNWDNSMIAAWLETLLFTDIEPPPLYFQQSPSSDPNCRIYNVLDGRHRIKVLSDFLQNKIKLTVHHENGTASRISAFEIQEFYLQRLLSKRWQVIIYICSSEEASNIFHQLNQQCPLSPAQRMQLSPHAIIQTMKRDDELLKQFMLAINESRMLKIVKQALFNTDPREQEKAAKAEEEVFEVAVKLCLLVVSLSPGCCCNNNQVFNFLSQFPNPQNIEAIPAAMRVFVEGFKHSPIILSCTSEGYSLFWFMVKNLEYFERDPRVLFQWYGSKVAHYRDDTRSRSRDLTSYFSLCGGKSTNSVASMNKRQELLDRLWKNRS